MRQYLESEVRRGGCVVGGQLRDKVWSLLRCREHAGCSCTYHIPASSSDGRNPPSTSYTHTNTHTHRHSVYIKAVACPRTLCSVCLAYVAVAPVIVLALRRAAIGNPLPVLQCLQPLGPSICFRPLGSPGLQRLAPHSPPTSFDSLALNFCPYVTTHHPLLPSQLPVWTCCHTQFSEFIQICVSLCHTFPLDLLTSDTFFTFYPHSCVTSLACDVFRATWWLVHSMIHWTEIFSFSWCMCVWLLAFLHS